MSIYLLIFVWKDSIKNLSVLSFARQWSKHKCIIILASLIKILKLEIVNESWQQWTKMIKKYKSQLFFQLILLKRRYYQNFFYLVCNHVLAFVESI